MKKSICRTMASDSGHQPICLVTGESISTEDACANQCNSVPSFGEVHECSNKIEYSFDSSIFFTRAGAPGSTAGTSAMDSIMQSSLFSDQDKVGPGNLEQHVFNNNSVQTDCAETTNELEENLETSLLALEGMNGISNFSDKHIPINLHEQGMYYVNMQDLHSKLVSMGPNQGRPVLVLANNPNKGIVEAKVIFDNSQSMDKLVKIQTKQAKRKNSGNKNKGKVADKCFVCGFDDCGRTFTTMGYLRQHQLSHNGERILECSFEGCGRKFAWPAHLRYHMLTHTGQRNYRCSYEGCGKQFYTSQRLGVHLRSHTGEKPYVCPEEGCDKSFSTAGNLKNHTRVHTGERPYVCHEAGCNRSFAEQSSLKKHQYTHTGKKMYICELCGKSFSQSGSRNVHMKGHFLSKSMKKGRPSKSTSVAPRSNEVDSSQNVLFIQQNQDDLYQFGNPDLHGSPCESVIFPHAVTKDVVAVTTQPGEGDLDLQNNILGAEEVLGNDDCMSTSLTSHTSGANVVVLSQPQEMSSLTTSYHSTQGVKEEIIYQSDLHLTLDHEEMTGNISLHDLHSDQQVHITTASSIAETTHAQSIDPIMEMDENESDDNESKLTIMCE